VSVDAFEEPCIAVEDKPRLTEQLGTNVRFMNNGVTLIKSRERLGHKLFIS